MNDLQTATIFINNHKKYIIYQNNQKKMKNHTNNKAFTLIEMLWVLAIVAILLSISTITIRHSQAKARDVVRKTDLQMIADALISYANDHGHFPSSIYDNWESITISQALNRATEWWKFKESWLEIMFYPDTEILKNILGLNPGNQLDLNMFDAATTEADPWLWTPAGEIIYTLKHDLDYNQNSNYETIASIIENAEKNTPVITDTWSIDTEMTYSIVTQGMCVSSLQKYLVNEWYLSDIPQDPSWESVNLQTNICADPWTFHGWVNANQTWRSIQWSECHATTNEWCTQICKEWYVYVSDWEHFALIAHMEDENWWNYETTSCWSCEIANQCKHTDWKIERTKTDQLPCDITDEFTNTFNCIQDNWVVEYSTWEYYFYIY